MLSIIKKDIWFILGMIAILLLWLIGSLVANNNIIIPTISEVVQKLFSLLISKKTILLIALTLVKLLLVIGVSSLLAIILAVISYRFHWFEKFISPFVSLIRVLPIATIIIILLIYIGIDFTPLIICFFVVFPIIYESILSSLKQIDKDIIEETKMISSINLYVIIKIYIPLISKYFISSMISTFGLGLKVLVMAEIISQGNNTIGEVIQVSRSVLDMSTIFAYTILLVVLVLLFNALMNFINKKIDL